MGGDSELVERIHRLLNLYPSLNFTIAQTEAGKNASDERFSHQAALIGRQSMSLAAELPQTISDFLCSECKSPWYVLLGTSEEYCFNPNCRIRDRSYVFPSDITKAEPLTTEMKQSEDAFLANLQKWKKGKIVEFAYRSRMSETKGLWDSGRVRIGQIVLLDDFLVRVHFSRTGSQSPSLNDFRRLLVEYADYRGRQTLIEDVEFGRFLVSTSGKTFVMKYWNTIREMFRNFGLINEESKDLEGTFRYQDVDAEAKQRAARPVFDFGAYFARLFDFSMTLRYGFELYNSDRLRHDYDPTTLELVTLLGLAYSSTKTVNVWPTGSLERHLKNNKVEGEDAARFMRKYVLGKELAPIIVQVDGRSLFDWWTILFYAHFLIAKNETRSPGATSTGADRIREVKGEASDVFDERIRQVLRNRGCKVAEEPLKVKFKDPNEEKEYDVVACDEKKKTIVIVEAKYRDLTSSSFSRDRLITQELLGEDGILAWAVSQQKRLDLLPKNPGRFNEKLSLSIQFI